MHDDVDVNEANRRSYERIAHQYAGDPPVEDDPVLRARTRELFMQRLRGSRVLEVGCGPGLDSAAFAAAGLNVTAIDSCRAFVDSVRQRAPHLDVREMDMRSVAFERGAFDGVYGFASFIHLPRSDAAETLQKFFRVLKPGGVVYLALIASSMHREYTLDLTGGGDAPLLFTCYGEDEFVDLLERAGFRACEILHVTPNVYEQSPRLIERGVHLFHAAGRVPDACGNQTRGGATA